MPRVVGFCALPGGRGVLGLGELEIDERAHRVAVGVKQRVLRSRSRAAPPSGSFVEPQLKVMNFGALPPPCIAFISALA